MHDKRPIFTVQKHRASRLHYDFRLEIGGVLASWAVPKGPSLDPAVKRLAIRVDDHELGYAEFEGVIAEGHYGAGPVLVWDIGWFEATGGAGRTEPAIAMLDQKRLDIRLHGHRLNGRFLLFEMKGRPGQWLLVKQWDAYARVGGDVTEIYTTSVLTGRTLEDLERAAAAGQLNIYRCGQ
jgi:bifunctional non-homologous end joining protein LigD